MMEATTGNSNALVRVLLEEGKLKNAAALARALGVAPPVISKLSNGSLPLGASMILNIHETFDMPVARIRELGGLPARVLTSPAAGL